jgi:hypothetical protein
LLPLLLHGDKSQSNKFSVLLARAPANQINHFEWNKNREKAGGAPRSR